LKEIEMNNIKLIQMLRKKASTGVTPLHIDDFPMPETEAPAFNTRYYLLLDNQSYRWDGGSDDTMFLNSGHLYLEKDKRDRANELLAAALTRKGSGECS
jgi:hypothetical protein